ncbi:SgcJ/EcaC family oxidoreductase [Burkholderia sp. BCC1977]|uniref:SgcJ/EcaC family oxidoreductase n=1 Tax=Burkholderia sp. BCC1977 TaxID=2817440 RepID=UPI002ABD6BAE|nr:SgcJ/EcaC family oxidoreductase [Burkholderia sp. BCC1977]
MKHFIIAAALLASHAAFAINVQTPQIFHQHASAPTDARDAEIASLFDRWNSALATGDADAVTRLYAPDGVLEPTVSNQVRTTPTEIRSYFVKFLKMKPRGTINFRQIRWLGDDAAVDTGIYTFDLVKDGKRQQVHARYTYVYKKVDGEWKILNHHSSAMPEALH